MTPEPIRYLSRADVEAVGLRGLDIVDILAGVFRAKRAGAVEMPPKIGVHPRPDAFIHAMPAYLEEADAVGIKWVAGYPDNQSLGLPYIHGLFVLSDAGSGRPLKKQRYCTDTSSTRKVVISDTSVVVRNWMRTVWPL